MQKNLSFKNKVYYPIIAVYLFYPLLYAFKDCYGCGYQIINNYDRITSFLSILIGLFGGLVIFYTAWRRKNQKLDNRSTALHMLTALALVLFFYPYMLVITLIDFAIFGLPW